MDNRILNPTTGELLNSIVCIKISPPIDDGRIRVAAIAAITGDAWEWGFFTSPEIVGVVAVFLARKYKVPIIQPRKGEV